MALVQNPEEIRNGSVEHIYDQEGGNHPTYDMPSWPLILGNVLKEMVIHFACWDMRLTDVTNLCLRRNLKNGYHNNKSQRLIKC